MNDTYIFMEDARLLIGTAKSYYQMFETYKIPFVYVQKNGRRSKAFLLSAVQELAKEVQAGRVGRM